MAVERLAYGPAELAEALGCTRQHVHNLIERGQLRSVKVGGKRVIPADAVAELLGQAPPAPVASLDVQTLADAIAATLFDKLRQLFG